MSHSCLSPLSHDLIWTQSKGEENRNVDTGIDKHFPDGVCTCIQPFICLSYPQTSFISPKKWMSFQKKTTPSKTHHVQHTSEEHNETKRRVKSTSLHDNNLVFFLPNWLSKEQTKRFLTKTNIRMVSHPHVIVWCTQLKYLSLSSLFCNILMRMFSFFTSL